MNKILLILFCVLFTNIYSQTATPPDSGVGSVGDPYQIASLENLYWIAANSANWNKYYIQTADIDAAATSGWNSGAGWEPIGNASIKFTGNYNGAHYTIDRLYISRSTTDYQGFFGYTQGATLQNIGVTNVSILGMSRVGALAGYLFSTSYVTNCFSTGTVTGTTSAIGGLVGYAHTYGTFARSYSSCTVVSTATSDDWVGGLIGVSNENGNITNCYATGNVTGYQRVGGLIGFAVNGGLSLLGKCYSTGKVTGGQVNHIGGLVGDNSLQPYTSNTFWDSQTSTRSNSMNGGTASTTANMKTTSTFTNSLWDFTGENTNGPNDYWSRDDNNNGGYPYLSWQTFPYMITFTDGSGFTQSPTPGQTNQPIGRIALITNTVGAEFNGIWFQLNGTRSGATNFKLWESTDNSFDSGSDTQIGITFTTDPGDGEYIWFTGLTARLSTSDKYYFLTCDLSGSASGSIEPLVVSNKEVMLGFGTLGSTLSNTVMSNSTSPLPVELTSFNATSVDDKVALQWATATEINNYGFEVERKITNTESWSVLGFVNGHGNSNAEKNYQFTDAAPRSGKNIYRLKQIDTDGQFEYSNVIEVSTSLPTVFKLDQNYPNPFNPSTEIRYQVPAASHVTLTVYDILGNKISTLVNEVKEAGSYQTEFTAEGLTSGVYFYRLEAGNFVQLRKMMVLK